MPVTIRFALWLVFAAIVLILLVRLVPSIGFREVSVRGRFARWMRRRHWAGFCLPVPFYGAVVLYWLSAEEERTGPLWFVRVHERAHAEQILRYGFLGFVLRYVWGLRKGYRKNPLEVAAYAAENAEFERREAMLRGAN